MLGANGEHWDSLTWDSRFLRVFLLPIPILRVLTPPPTPPTPPLDPPASWQQKSKRATWVKTGRTQR